MTRPDGWDTKRTVLDAIRAPATLRADRATERGESSRYSSSARPAQIPGLVAKKFVPLSLCGVVSEPLWRRLCASLKKNSGSLPRDRLIVTDGRTGRCAE